MDSVRKKVLLDLFVTPATVISGTLGVTFVLLSTMFSGNMFMPGLFLILSSLGIMGTNCIFNLEKTTKSAIEELHRIKSKEQKRRLDILDANLVKDKDPRDQTALRNMRAVYESFKCDFKNGKIPLAVSYSSLIDGIDEIFIESIYKLERSFEMWKVSRKTSGDLRDEILEQRDLMIQEVEESSVVLINSINEIRDLKIKSDNKSMVSLRDQLVKQLDIAKATHQSLESLNFEKDYSEYQ